MTQLSSDTEQEWSRGWLNRIYLSVYLSASHYDCNVGLQHCHRVIRSTRSTHCDTRHNTSILDAFTEGYSLQFTAHTKTTSEMLWPDQTVLRFSSLPT